MKARRFIEYTMGFLSGILAPVFGVVMFFELKPEFTLYENFDPVAFKSLIFQIASVGLILNMLIFFLALQFNKEVVSRGVIHASVLFLVAVSIYKFVL